MSKPADNCDAGVASAAGLGLICDAGGQRKRVQAGPYLS
jgi:hypothetical protein